MEDGRQRSREQNEDSGIGLSAVRRLRPPPFLQRGADRLRALAGESARATEAVAPRSTVEGPDRLRHTRLDAAHR